MKEPILVIMAAGIGSRYGGLKQMDPIGKFDEKIIDYSVYDAYKAGFKRVIFIINRNIESDFKAIIGKRIERFMKVGYAFQDLNDVPEGVEIASERIKPLGTGHAVYAARHLIDAPFVVINADDFYGRDAFEKIYSFLIHDVSEKHYSMIGFKLKNTVTDHGYVSRGICKTNQEHLINVEEKLHIEIKDNRIQYLDDGIWYPLSDDQIVSMNMWGFHETIIDEIEKIMVTFFNENLHNNPLKCEFFLPFIVDQSIKKDIGVKVIETESKWYGVTYQEDKAQVVQAISEMIAQEQYPIKLWED